MHRLYDRQTLAAENAAYRGTMGVSEGNRGRGFLPAFLDTDTGRVYLPRLPDGRPAPCHLLDGLPPELIARRRRDGHAEALKAGVEAGFVRGECFYSRAEALALA